MAEQPIQIRGNTQIKTKTIDKSRLNADGETVGYILKAQLDGSMDFEPITTSDITDFDITSVVEGDRLAYNTATSKWENRSMRYDAEYRAYLLE